MIGFVALLIGFASVCLCFAAMSFYADVIAPRRRRQPELYDQGRERIGLENEKAAASRKRAAA